MIPLSLLLTHALQALNLPDKARENVIAAADLDFGPWEQIFYGEFDGRRAKRVLVKLIGD